jgi:hypothetical protein
VNPLDMLIGPAPALLLRTFPESSDAPEVNMAGLALDVVGVILGAIGITVVVVVGLAELAERRRVERARIADCVAQTLAIRVRQHAAAATRRLQHSSPVAAPTVGVQQRKERRSWPGRSCRKPLSRPRWEGPR